MRRCRCHCRNDDLSLALGLHNIFIRTIGSLQLVLIEGPFAARLASLLELVVMYSPAYLSQDKSQPMSKVGRFASCQFYCSVIAPELSRCGKAAW